MSKYLNPKYDITFKRVFGEHKDLCISLINSMLPFEEGREVVSIEYETGEILPEIHVMRNSIVDVRCIDNEGRRFIVEMQMNWSKSFLSRVLFNASKAYVKQLKPGEEFELLQPVYALNFVNDNYEKSPDMADEYYHHYKIVNCLHTEKQIEGLEFVFIELKKYVPSNRAERKLRDLWLRFLTEINENTMEAPRELLDCADTLAAVKCVEVCAYTRGELDTYDKFGDSISVERSFISDAARSGKAEGLVEGEAKGRAKGLAEGEAKGRAEGLAEGEAKGRAEGEAERIKLQQRIEELERQQEKKTE